MISKYGKTCNCFNNNKLMEFNKTPYNSYLVSYKNVLIDLWNRGGFHLRKWSYNDPDLISICQLKVSTGILWYHNPRNKMLGLMYVEPKKGYFQFAFQHQCYNQKLKLVSINWLHFYPTCKNVNHANLWSSNLVRDDIP